jgi:hypothetical protein
MTDTERELDELQRKLTARTREIEALVAEEQDLGDINAEELIAKWQEADVDRSGSNPDTPVNRLIAERQEIEEQILALQVR